jgi:hypothetical protein
MSPKKRRPCRPIQYLTATGIARRLGRSHKAVIRAIERLGIPADALLTAGNGYLESRVKQIAAGMRRKNGQENPIPTRP